MKKIVFFNHAHRGDVFISKSFVEDIQKQISTDYSYAHYWGEYLIKDIDINYLTIDSISHISKLNQHVSTYVTDDTVYINTWIGNYFGHFPSSPYYGHCNIIATYELMYKNIYSTLSEIFETELKLNPNIAYYVPDVKYNYFNTDPVNDFVSKDNNRKILFCNGPAESGQCEYNGDLLEVIESISNKYKDITLITTHKLGKDIDNVKFTGDIIKNSGSDLNEISYLSEFCDIIVGRSSGPFVWCGTKKNIQNSEKSFLCFGAKETDCLVYNIDVESQFVFQYFSNQNKLNEIEETIEDMICDEEKV